MKPKVISQEDVEPITLEEARAHLEQPQYGDSDDDPADTLDDAMIMSRLTAAREYCEDFLGLSLTPRVLEIALDRFPTTRCEGRTWIELPMGPVTEIRAITIPDASGDSDDTDASEVEASTYALDDFNVPARAYPVSSWPALTAGTNAVRIQYSAGYGVSSDGESFAPKVLLQAVLLMLGYFHKNREDEELKGAAEALMRPRRVLLGMA